MALVPITHVYDTLSVINNTGLLDGQILYTTDQTVNKIFADVKVNNILRRIEIGGTNTIDTVLDQNSGHAIANSAVAKLAQTVHTNLLNPTLQTTTVNEVTCTNNGDGTYTLNGHNTSSTEVYFNLMQGRTTMHERMIEKIGKNLQFSGVKNGGTSTFSLTIYFYDSQNQGTGSKRITDDVRNDVVIPENSVTFSLGLRLYAGATATNVVIKPMLTTDLSATYDDFVQYSGNGELNENVADLYNNLATTNTNLTALDTKVGAQSLLPTPSQSVTQNINTLKAEINQLNSDLSAKQNKSWISQGSAPGNAGVAFSGDFTDIFIKVTYSPDYLFTMFIPKVALSSTYNFYREGDAHNICRIGVKRDGAYVTDLYLDDTTVNYNTNCTIEVFTR
jgi:hypothetical protein